MLGRSLLRASTFASTSKVTLEQFSRSAHARPKPPSNLKDWRSWFFNGKSGRPSRVPRVSVSQHKKEHLQQRLALYSDAELLERIRNKRSTGAYLWNLLCRLEERGRLDQLTETDINYLFKRVTPSLASNAKASVVANNATLQRRFSFVLELFSSRGLPLQPVHLFSAFRSFRRYRSAPAALHFFSVLRSRGVLEGLESPVQAAIMRQMLASIHGWLRAHMLAGALTAQDAKRMQLACDAIVARMQERQLMGPSSHATALSILRMTSTKKSFFKYVLDVFKMDLALPAAQQPSPEVALSAHALNTIILQFRDQNDLSRALAAFESHAYASREVFALDKISSPIFSNILHLAKAHRSPLLLRHYFAEALNASVQALRDRLDCLQDAIHTDSEYTLRPPAMYLASVHFSLVHDRRLFPPRVSYLRTLLHQLDTWMQALTQHQREVSKAVLQQSLRGAQGCKIDGAFEYGAFIDKHLAWASRERSKVLERKRRLAETLDTRKLKAAKLKALTPHQREILQPILDAAVGHQEKLMVASRGKRIVKRIGLRQKAAARSEAQAMVMAPGRAAATNKPVVMEEETVAAPAEQEMGRLQLNLA